MIDTHAHIDGNAYDEDRELVIQRAFEQGLEAIVIPGIEPKGFDGILDLCERHDRIYSAIGVHPHDSADLDDSIYDNIKQRASHPKVVAIGEIGLDYYYDFSPKDKQQEAFRKQLRIAKELGLPVIIHNRESDSDLLEILNEEQDGTLQGVLHCFSSDSVTMNKALDLGFHISFTGNITYKKSTLGDLVRELPLDRLLLETDSPYMTPHPNRGKRNEPANVRFVAEKISEIKSISINEVISMTTTSAKKLFKLSLLLLFFIISSKTVFSQSEEYFDTTNSKDREVLVHPFKKTFGFGGYIGFNTIVEDRFLVDVNGKETGKTKPNTYEGIVAFGGGVLYSPLDFMIVEGSYVYSKNTKNLDEYGVVDYYHIFELATHWIPNPYSRVNFFGTIGFSYLHNIYGENPTNAEANSKSRRISDASAINAGVGFLGNIQTGFGLINIKAEWRLNFLLNKVKTNDMSRNNESGQIIVTPVNADVFFSIPRLGIIFYPKL